MNLFDHFLFLYRSTATVFEMQASYELKSQVRGFLDYAYAPATGLLYLITLILGICTLQKEAILSLKRRNIVVLSMFIIALSYILEALFYVYPRPAGDDRSVPHHALFRDFSVALV